MKKFLLSFLIATMLVGVLQAQPSSPGITPSELPEGLLIVKPRGDSRTSITVTCPASRVIVSGQHSAALKPVVLKRITIIQSGDMAVEETAEIGGRRSQTWRSGGYSAMFNSIMNKTTFSFQGGNGVTQSSVNAAADYPGFEWISTKNFTGIEKIQGKEYITFKEPSTESAAFVDLATRLPVTARQVDLTYTYEFGPAPSGVITLPAEMQKAIADYKARQEVGARRAAKPY